MNVPPANSKTVWSVRITQTSVRNALTHSSITITNVKRATQIVRSVLETLIPALNARLANFFMLDNVSHAEQTVMNVQS